jgi:cystathionine beta-lyase/cystathionine gamma-synthase
MVRVVDGEPYPGPALAALGGTHTKGGHAASTAHRQLKSRAPESAGIDPGAVRFSIGLEDAEDLISDAYVAFDCLAPTGKH